MRSRPRPRDRAIWGIWGVLLATAGCTAPPADPVDCQPPLTLCGEACVDTATDEEHCGSCSRACPPGDTCRTGECVAGCPDQDGDGHPAAACGGDDCDDAAAEVSPSEDEASALCGDGVDNDCDGLQDGADPGCPPCAGPGSPCAESAYFGMPDVIPSPTDFNGDGRAEVCFWHPRSGAWFISDPLYGQITVAWGAEGDIPVAGDYFGDSRGELAVFRPSTGEWHFLVTSPGGQVALSQTTIQFGTLGDVPAPADYDADGTNELAVFRPDNGDWYVRDYDDPTTTQTHFGASGDVPVPADYDGDQSADLAVWRPSASSFYVHRTSGGEDTVPFGTAGDVPVAANFGGGRAKLTVFRPANGSWYWRDLLDGTNGQAEWGSSGDVPAPSDFDGDGASDHAVYRPSGFLWLVNPSGSPITLRDGIWRPAFTMDEALPPDPDYMYEIRSLAVFQDRLYAGATFGRIYSYDGVSWSLAYQAPEAPHYARVFAFAEFEGRLLAGFGGSAGGDAPLGEIHVFDGTTWSLLLATGEENVRSMAVFEDTLYVGTGYDGNIYSYDGESLSLATTIDGMEALAMLVSGSTLLVGTGYCPICGTVGPGRVYSFDGSDWREEASFAEPHVFAIDSYGGATYAATGWTGPQDDPDKVGRIYRQNADTWEEVFASVVHDPEVNDQEMFIDIEPYNGRLFAGTYEFTHGAIIYEFDGSSWRIAYDSPNTRVYAFQQFGEELFAGTGILGNLYAYSEPLDP